MRRHVRRLGLVVLLAAVALLGRSPATPAATLPPAGEPKPLPELEFTDAEGETVGLDAFEGRVVVLNLWATWCAPCKKEMPSLDRLQAELGDRGLAVVPVSLDLSTVETTALRSFYDDLGLDHLAVYRDTSMATSRALQSPGLPTTVIVDREGNEVSRVLGEVDWTSGPVLDVLNGVLGR